MVLETAGAKTCLQQRGRAAIGCLESSCRTKEVICTKSFGNTRVSLWKQRQQLSCDSLCGCHSSTTTTHSFTIFIFLWKKKVEKKFFQNFWQSIISLAKCCRVTSSHLRPSRLTFTAQITNDALLQHIKPSWLFGCVIHRPRLSLHSPHKGGFAMLQRCSNPE